MSEKDAIYQVVMPRLGLTMTEGKIIEWVKADGEWVQKGETLFIIENEKSTVEIEAPADGYLKISTAVNVTVPVLTPVGTLSSGTVSGHHTAQQMDGPHDAAAFKLLPETSPRVPDVPHASSVGTLSSGTVSGHHAAQQMEEPRDAAAFRLLPETLAQGPDVSPILPVFRASPKARALARKLNVSLEGISGTGLRGMVVAEDVQRVAAKPTAKASPVAQRVAEAAGLDLASVAGSGTGGRIMRGDVEKALRQSQPVEPHRDTAPLPLSGLRGIIAERLSQSWRERPQVTLTTEADATNLVAARQQLNAELASTGEKISYNALLIKLVAQALREQPNLNAQLTANGLQTMPEINLGLAVDTERGLLVPVVRGVPAKSLRQVNAEINALAERAIKGRSLPDELTGGTFTVTNLGVYDIDAFTPLINPPECAILGVGRIVSKPVGLNGQIVLREMLALSLSFDHRLVDGAPAAKFLQRVKQLIERPLALAL